jgi:hypothetical protein
LVLVAGIVIGNEDSTGASLVSNSFVLIPEQEVKTSLWIVTFPMDTTASKTTALVEASDIKVFVPLFGFL